MEIKLEIAFQEAMEEINDLSKRLILERSVRRQMEEENEDLKKRNKELEGRLMEMEKRMLELSNQQE